jgi:hypothetical protein
MFVDSLQNQTTDFQHALQFACQLKVKQHVLLLEHTSASFLITTDGACYNVVP